ncbi:MAG: metal-dependent hydrolase [Verrucomicrobia bacterium]|nr:metal-dependent hydrolase [Verrucomicrobiota bacterium]MBU1733612.1 metal-dependent hydrolase [Verrucomicrobiota bacterium]MBU1856786.1 metal-dependent hydrolase [Verrucomicrobiota bacterium]
MDTLAHALYGVTFFSRIGFAGFFKNKFNGSVKRWNVDWTIFAAAGFAVLPDLASIGIYFLNLILNSQSPTFHHLPRYVFDLYNATHSLLVAVLVCLILWEIWKPLFIPSLAWIFHIGLDVFTHGHGRFQTPFLYPLSNYSFDGLDWWINPWVVAVYWGALPLLWAFIYFQRRKLIRMC